MVSIPEKGILSLRKILESTSDESIVETNLSLFKCSIDQDIEDFLIKRAISFEKAHKSRTYLIVAPESSGPGRLRILAYFSVAIHHLQIPNEVSKSIKRKLNGIFNNDSVPCYLIGQLARSDSCPKEDLRGHEIIEYALNVVLNAHELVGGRFALIECKGHEGLLSFYMDNDFTLLPVKEGEYCQLVKFIQAEKSREMEYSLPYLKRIFFPEVK